LNLLGNTKEMRMQFQNRNRRRRNLGACAHHDATSNDKINECRCDIANLSKNVSRNSTLATASSLRHTDDKFYGRSIFKVKCSMRETHVSSVQ
jgi:hypothetical protein